MAFKHIRAAQDQQVGDANAKIVLVTIASYIGTDGQAAFPSLDTLAQKTELHRNTVDKKVTYLQENGFIKVEKRGRNNYYTLFLECDNVVDQSSHTDYDNVTIKNDESSHPECDNVTIEPLETNELSHLETRLSHLEERLSHLETQSSHFGNESSHPECDVSSIEAVKEAERREEKSATLLDLSPNPPLHYERFEQQFVELTPYEQELFDGLGGICRTASPESIKGHAITLAKMGAEWEVIRREFYLKSGWWYTQTRDGKDGKEPFAGNVVNGYLEAVAWRSKPVIIKNGDFDPFNVPKSITFEDSGSWAH